MAENQQYDIVFVLDESASMQGPIDKVKDNMKSFAEKLKTEGVDAQFGLVEYGYDRSKYDEVKKYDLTHDVDAFIEKLDNISADGSEENGLTAIMDGTNGAISMNFREGSNKEIIVVTNEGYEENDSHYSMKANYSQDSVIAQLQDMGAKLDVFGAIKNSDHNQDFWNVYWGEGWCQEEWEPIANATSGRLIEGDGNPVNGRFYDIKNDFSTLFKAALIDGVVELDGVVEPPVTGTHQVSFTQWSFGYTPTDAAATLASDPNSSITITPNA